jgi:diamine N-acetyltransferase
MPLQSRGIKQYKKTWKLFFDLASLGARGMFLAATIIRGSGEGAGRGTSGERHRSVAAGDAKWSRRLCRATGSPTPAPGGESMGLISYRPLRAEDADAVFDAAREAWRFTYATIFDTVFIDQFVRTNYAPDRLSALVPAVAAQHMFFDVALDGDRIVGFCNIGVTPRGAELFRIYLMPAYIGMGVGNGLLERGEHFLRTRRVPSYHCFVHKDNELGKRFYLRRGFRHLSDSDRNDEWYMEKVLS